MDVGMADAAEIDGDVNVPISRRAAFELKRGKRFVGGGCGVSLSFHDFFLCGPAYRMRCKGHFDANDTF
jgi:hypothetical protein